MPKKKEKPRAQIRPEIKSGPIGRPGAGPRPVSPRIPGGEITPRPRRGMGIRRERPAEPPRRKVGMGTPPNRQPVTRAEHAARPPVIKHGREIMTPGRRREEWRRRRAS